MPADFLDTSALAKHYHLEAGSAEVDRLWNDPVRGLFVSRLWALEIVSVFAAKVRAGLISTGDFDSLRRRFLHSRSMTLLRRVCLCLFDNLNSNDIANSNCAINPRQM